jgi:hypothetical protein
MRHVLSATAMLGIGHIDKLRLSIVSQLPYPLENWCILACFPVNLSFVVFMFAISTFHVLLVLATGYINFAPYRLMKNGASSYYPVF